MCDCSVFACILIYVRTYMYIPYYVHIHTLLMQSVLLERPSSRAPLHSNLRCSAAELLGRGFHLWEKYVDIPQVRNHGYSESLTYCLCTLIHMYVCMYMYYQEFIEPRKPCVYYKSRYKYIHAHAAHAIRYIRTYVRIYEARICRTRSMLLGN